MGQIVEAGVDSLLRALVVGSVSTLVCGCTSDMLHSVDITRPPTAAAAEVVKGETLYGVYPLMQSVLAVKITAAPSTLTAAEQKQCSALTDDYKKLSAQGLESMHWRLTLAGELRAIDLVNLKHTAIAAMRDKLIAAHKKYLGHRAKDVDQENQAHSIAMAYDSRCQTPVNLQLEQSLAADNKRLFALYMADDAWSSDTLTMKFDDQGLLMQVKSTADDKTADVLAAAAKSVVSISSQSGGFEGLLVTGYRSSPGEPVPEEVFADILKETEGGIRNKYDIGDAGALTGAMQDEAYLEALASYRSSIVNGLTTFGSLPPLEVSVPKDPVVYRLSEWTGSQNVFRNYFLDLNCTRLDGAMASAGYATFAGDKSKPNDPLPGVVVSSPQSCTATFSQTGADGGPIVLASGDFYGLNSQTTINLSVPRTRLINRQITYDFKQGRLTAVTASKPSTALAVVSLPTTIIDAVINQLSGSIQGRTDLIKKENEQMSAKASFYDAQARLLAAEAAAAQKGKTDSKSAGQADSEP